MLTTAPSVTRVSRPVEEADVLVVEEHVDEAAQLAAVVVEPLAEAGVRGVERAEHLADGRAVDAHLGRAAGEVAQLGGDADGDGHSDLLRVARCLARTRSRRAGNAARNASSDGGIVAVTRTCGSMASSVFSPCPVM